MREKPIHVKQGAVTVKVYVTNNAGYTEFKVVDYSTGHRRFHSFADETDARKKAKEIAAALTRGEANILTLRGQKVIMDGDLARIYGVLTRRLNEQVKRNAAVVPSRALPFPAVPPGGRGWLRRRTSP